MNHFEFEYPYAFLLLGFIICLYKCPLSIEKILFPHTHLFVKHTQWFELKKLLYSLILTLLVTALASPISYDAQTTHTKKGRDLIFTLDTSGSMAESGFSKEQRNEKKFTILKNFIKEFITHRYDDNVGVSIFGSYAFSAIPLSYDMDSISFLLNFLEVGMAGENTAIGDGLMNALSLLEKSDAQKKVVILVTDGYQNSGRFSIHQAVEKAKKMGVHIYTIGLGQKGEFDTKLLKKIAQETEGKMFMASDASTLKNIYQKLNTLQPSPLQSQGYLNKHMLFEYPLSFAILLLLFLLSRSRSKL
jgi:Ca-activated chloride channel family protein